MQISVDYNHGPESKESNIETTVNLITYGVQQHYKDGFDGQGGLRRMYGRMQRKMDKAVQDKVNVIDFEMAELEIIKKVLEQVKYLVAWSKWVSALEDAVNKAMLPQEPAAPVAPAKPLEQPQA